MSNRKAKKAFLPPLAGQLLKKLAPKIGARVVLEPAWGVAGQIIFKNGRKRYFRYSSLDVNTLGSSELSKDKDYANFFMHALGYPTIEGRTFYSDDWAAAIGSDQTLTAAYRYAKKRGFPVIVKPNSLSQGKGVSLSHNKREFYRAMRAAFELDRVVLVQEPIGGRDYRIVVLDGIVISAYGRMPLSVVGDGRSTIKQLLIKKQQGFADSGRDPSIRLDDPRMREKLARSGLTFRSVLATGVRQYLLDNANLSSGGDALDVTQTMHPSWKRLAVRLSRDMGLRLCGVDLLTEDDIAKPLGKYKILEINAAPGLDHYAKNGRAQQKIVEHLYLELLKSLSR